LNCAAGENSRRLFNTTGKSCTEFLRQDYGPVPEQIIGLGVCIADDRDHLLPYRRGPSKDINDVYLITECLL